MIAMSLRFLIVPALITIAWPGTSAGQSGSCKLLTNAEVVQHIDRGRQNFDPDPKETSVLGGKGSICQYTFGQVVVWTAPNAEQNLESFIKAWKVTMGDRKPVTGVGDRAWIAFPVPNSKYEDRAAFVVANVGQQVVTVALFAHDGNAESSMGEICRRDQAKMKPREQEDCKKILADKSETQESLQPAVTALATLVVEKVRAGKG